MIYVRFPYPWITELLVLFLVLGLLVKVFVANSRKIRISTEKMWDSTRTSQAFLQQVDQEFDTMNKCAKSIKNVFLNFSKVYKEISKGTKTVEEAIREAKINLPEELRNKFSRAFVLTEDAESVDESFPENSSSDIYMVKAKQMSSDDEQQQEKAYGLFRKGSDPESELRSFDLVP